ncbi:MAG: YbaK/EbsC family protein [Candidatus Dojkabacteria bacterium]|nr:MAG: YbaK/EbsC family protein [Candidatus Dojkabacteria bacterium]
MTLHPLTQTITKLLESNEFWFETFTHAPVKTSEEAAKIRTGYTLSQGAKALIVRFKRKSGVPDFAMFVLPADKRFSSSKVKKILFADDVRFATEEEVSKVTKGVLPGGVPPMGNLFSISVYVDESLGKNEKIIFNAGDRQFSVAMYFKDYLEIVAPIVTSFVSP